MPYIHDEWCDYSGIYSAVCGCVDNRHNHKSEVFKMNTDRLRFRFYSIELKRYLSSFEIHAILFSTPASAEYVDDGEDYWQFTCSPDDGFIEQCTGLEDQSGKLIYEGDVVDYYNPMADDHYQGVVTFDDNEDTASGYYIKGNREGWQSYLEGSHCRVIGNIHEQETMQ